MSDYGLDPKQLVQRIIRPTLQYRLNKWTRSAEVLVLGTALVESRLRYVDQVDKKNRPGPAFGVWQMEGPTHADHYRNYLNFPANKELKLRVIKLATFFSGDFPDPGEMAGNLYYACAMCRIDYLRAKPALPGWNDAAGMAAYHKSFYNSAAGKTKVDESIEHFEFAIKLGDMT